MSEEKTRPKTPNGGELEILNITVPPAVMEAIKTIDFWAASQGIKNWQIGSACSRIYAAAIERAAPHLRAINPRTEGDATRAQMHNSAVKLLRRFVVGD